MTTISRKRGGGSSGPGGGDAAPRPGTPTETKARPTRAYVLHPVIGGRRRAGGKPAGGTGTGGAAERPPDIDARLEEAVGLAEAIALEVAGARAVVLAKPTPATLVGGGVVEETRHLVALGEIDLVVMDGHLTPVQQRNLEKAWSCKVIDRTGLILEIFGERARTAEGRLQVDLAALTYQRSRLVRSWTHLERQRGGFGFLGGPGERQIESDRRRLSEQIERIEKQLEDVRRTRGLHRDARKRVPYPIVALVGYTNAGKSTLFNRLTSAEVLEADMLFATLDPTMRALRLPSGRTAILSDTVGFISDLPTQLVAAFRATLEEVEAADVVVHVRDIASPESARQREDVLAVLAGLGVGEKRDLTEGLIEAWNKVDLLPAAERDAVFRRAEGREDTVAVSAATGEGCLTLLTRIEAALARDEVQRDYRVPAAEGRALAWLYRHGRVLARDPEDTYIRVRVGLSAADAARFEREWTGILD